MLVLNFWCGGRHANFQESPGQDCKGRHFHDQAAGRPAVVGRGQVGPVGLTALESEQGTDGDHHDGMYGDPGGPSNPDGTHRVGPLKTGAFEVAHVGGDATEPSWGQAVGEGGYHLYREGPSEDQTLDAFSTTAAIK